MITVTICQSSEGEITGFSIQGHAGYAERGSDIVCAAVSVLAQNTVNSIEQFTQDSFSASKLLLDSLILGLQGIEEEYMDYLDVIFEEV